MDPTLLASGLLVVVLIALALVVRHHVDRVGRLRDELAETRARARELRDANARWAEAWGPLMAGYPFDARRFRFVGAPVDGVQFESDRVVFVTFARPGREPDARVRDLVRAGRVEWMEWPVGRREESTPVAEPTPEEGSSPVEPPEDAWRPDEGAPPPA